MTLSKADVSSIGWSLLSPDPDDVALQIRLLKHINIKTLDDESYKNLQPLLFGSGFMNRIKGHKDDNYLIFDTFASMRQASRERDEQKLINEILNRRAGISTTNDRE